MQILRRSAQITRGASAMIVMAALPSTIALAQGDQGYSDPQRAGLKAIRTVLVAGDAESGASIENSSYDVVISVKLKLEQVGYHVVLDPREKHDAVLLIEYQESPGREYPALERGIKISAAFTLYRPGTGKLLSYPIEVESSWPRPFGSLYWDAIQNLEENAYYYYLGELIRGWLTSQTEIVEVFMAMLREPPLFQSLDGSDNIVTPRMAANQNARLHAIRELGIRKDPRALDTLWRLVWEGNNPERRAAVTAIGAIGSPASIEPLQELVSSAGPLSGLASEALARIRAGQ